MLLCSFTVELLQWRCDSSKPAAAGRGAFPDSEDIVRVYLVHLNERNGGARQRRSSIRAAVHTLAALCTNAIYASLSVEIGGGGGIVVLCRCGFVLFLLARRSHGASYY